MAIEKNLNSGGHFGDTSLTALPIQPIHCKNGPNGLNWQCCLGGSPKTSARILIFSIAMGADYSIELIETYVPQFIGHNKIFLGSVLCLCLVAGYVKRTAELDYFTIINSFLLFNRKNLRHTLGMHSDPCQF